MIRLIWSFILKWGWDYNRNRGTEARGLVAVSESDFGEPIRFSVTPANGGVVVAVRTYDKIKDRTKESIHVIHEDIDYAQAVGNIVAMEILKS